MCNKIIHSIAISILLVVFALAGNLPNNLWSNSDLETASSSSTAGAPAGWYRGGNDYGTENGTPLATFWATDNSMSAAHSMKIQDNSVDKGFDWYTAATPIPGMSSLSELYIRWNWKAQDIQGGPGYMQLLWNQTNDQGISLSQGTVPAGGTFDWKEETITVPVASGATRLTLAFRGYFWYKKPDNTWATSEATTGTLWIDDISVGPSFASTLQADLGFAPRAVSRSDIGLSANEVMKYDFMGISYSNLIGYKGTDYYDQMLLEMAITGMINRSEPLIWLGQQSWGWNAGESTWLNHYARTQKYSFVTISGGLDALLMRCAHVFNGIVLYDPTPSDNIFLAANIANQNFCLPVSVKLYNAHKSSFGSLPIVLSIDANAMTRTQIYDWLIANLLPLCDRTGVHSAGSTFTDITLGEDWWNYILGFDYAFYRKFFIYNISCVSAPYSWNSLILSGSPEMKAEHDAIMSALTPPAFVCGWLQAEYEWCKAASQYGHYIACTTGGVSLSFHAGVKPVSPPPYIQDTKPKKRLPENKVYLAYFSNEGDTTNVLCFNYYRAWQDGARGQLPMTWGLGPQYARLFPAMVEYYYMTKTDNDYFMSAPSGAGYHYPSFSKSWAAFCQYTQQQYTTLFPEREISLWLSSDNDADIIASNMPSIRGVVMLPDNSDPYGRRFYTAKRHTPVIRYATAMNYWQLTDKPFFDASMNLNADAYESYLNSVYANVSKPWYLPSYGLQDGMVSQIVNFVKTRLDPNKFEVIDYGTMMHLAGIPSGTIDWNNNYIYQAYRWSEPMNGALISSSPNGLRITVGPGKTWAIAAIPNLLLPDGTRNIHVKVSACTGTDWIVKMSGDWNQTGSWTDWLPFGVSTSIGDFATQLPSSVLFDLDRRPLRYLQLGIDGASGSYVDFDFVTFNPKDGDINLDGTVDLKDFSNLASGWRMHRNVYQENLGQVNMEAECYSGNVDANGWSWVLGIGNGSSGQYMRSQPDTGMVIDANINTNSPHLSYAVNFADTGTYYLWTKGKGIDWGTTVHFGIDGVPISFNASTAITLPRSFGWVVKTINIPSPIIHTIDFWMRQDGTMLDKMILTKNSSYQPSQVMEPAKSTCANLEASGEINGDGVVNFDDLTIIGSNWLN